jgi:hypothetical protein
MRPRPTWLLIALLGCGTPSRHLTTRIVDDPMVLPRRMLSLGLTGQVSQRPGSQLTSGDLSLINYGLTDRLELDSLLSLRWAILDDAPLPVDWNRRPDRLSLSVRGGAFGLGTSSVEGFTIFPVASVQMRKHLGGRALVSLNTTWEGKWVENPYGWGWPYREDLWPTRSRASSLTMAAEGLRQFGDHVALVAGGSVHQLQGCTLPSCSWAARGGELWLGPQARPWRWLTLSLRLFAGRRYRPAGQPVRSPDEQLVFMPETASWLGTEASLAFQW